MAAREQHTTETTGQTHRPCVGADGGDQEKAVRLMRDGRPAAGADSEGLLQAGTSV